MHHALFMSHAERFDGRVQKLDHLSQRVPFVALASPAQLGVQTGTL